MVSAQLAPRLTQDDRLAVLCGPTAVGKTALAVAVARRLDAEILCADSRTVYRGLDIGTAKPDAAQRALVPHHLLDVMDPTEAFTVRDFQRLAQAAIEAIRARGRLPLIVGGTGLYIRAVVDRLRIPDVAPDEGLRVALAAEARERGPGHLHQRLAGLDPVAAARIHPHNVRRVIRALEVAALTGRPISAQRGRDDRRPAVAMIGLITERATLYRWIDERVDAQLASGLVDETRALLARGVPPAAPAMQSLGYKEIGGWLRGLYAYEEAVRRLKRNTRRYAKRQLTWFGRDPRIRWLEIGRPDDARGPTDAAEALAARVHAMMEHEFITPGRT
jgi:tRNA dimethylallyltransferase